MDLEGNITSFHEKIAPPEISSLPEDHNNDTRLNSAQYNCTRYDYSTGSLKT